MKDKLIIVGASGHGKVILDIAFKMKRWKEIYFLDDDESKNECLGFKVLGKTNDYKNFISDSDFFIGIGNNKIREEFQIKFLNDGASIATLIHPSANIGLDVSIGIGTVIMAGVSINSSTKIGDGCIINTNSSIDHDNFIEDFVHVSPGAILAGTVRVGKRTWICSGVTVINNIEIVSDCIIGSGSLVIKNILKSGKYFGIPTRRNE